MSTPNADPVGDLAGHHPQLRERVRRVLEPFGRSYYQACVARGEPVQALWQALALHGLLGVHVDRKSTRLNSSHT